MPEHFLVFVLAPRCVSLLPVPEHFIKFGFVVRRLFTSDHKLQSCSFELPQSPMTAFAASGHDTIVSPANTSVTSQKPGVDVLHVVAISIISFDY